MMLFFICSDIHCSGLILIPPETQGAADYHKVNVDEELIK